MCAVTCGVCPPPPPPPTPAPGAPTLQPTPTPTTPECSWPAHRAHFELPWQSKEQLTSCYDFLLHILRTLCIGDLEFMEAIQNCRVMVEGEDGNRQQLIGDAMDTTVYPATLHLWLDQATIDSCPGANPDETLVTDPEVAGMMDRCALSNPTLVPTSNTLEKDVVGFVLLAVLTLSSQSI